MGIWKTKLFQGWQKKTDLTNEMLLTAVAEMSKGLVDSELGNGLVKKRIARKGRGKRSGYRTIIATNQENKWFFVYGFAKNEQDNISPKELIALKDLADYMLKLLATDINQAIENGALIEVFNDEK